MEVNIYSEPMFSGSQISSLPGPSQQQQVTQKTQINQDEPGPFVQSQAEAGPSTSLTQGKPDDDQEDEDKFDLMKLMCRASDLRQDYCTTGCPILDGALSGGGIPTFGITELYGEAGCGKTQFCLQLSLMAQLPKIVGGLGSNVFYICTEDTFPSKRLAELIHPARRKFPDLPNVPMDNIFVERVDGSETLLQCIQVKLPVLLSRSPESIRLLIVDSVAGIFRSEFQDLRQRTAELRQFGQALHEFSLDNKAAVLVCNQVTGDPSSLERNVASLGMVWKNMITTRIRLSKSDDHQRRTLTAVFSPHIPPDDVYFKISADGISGEERN